MDTLSRNISPKTNNRWFTLRIDRCAAGRKYNIRKNFKDGCLKSLLNTIIFRKLKMQCFLIVET